MKLTLYLVLFWANLLSGTAQSQDARLVAEPCPDALLPLADLRLNCSRLHIPEDRSSDSGAWISLFVAQIAARQDMDNPPIVYLAGGPGDSASADIEWWLNASLGADYDIILIDQRGAGFSRPSLNCPEFDASDDDKRLVRCRARLQADGIDLAAYKSASIAQDIAALIAALELDQVNIYARSYGARLALLLAQNLPQRIRAMALDGAYTGAESALENAAAGMRESLQLLFADCKANEACHIAYPQLSTQFVQAAAALNAQPAAVLGVLPKGDLLLDERSFVLLLRNMLADANRLAYIPALIAAVAEGDDDFLASLEISQLGQASPGVDSHSEGLYFSTLCADEAALTTAEKIKASGDSLPPAFWPLAQFSLDLLADCGLWLGGSAVFAIEPSTEEIPTLLLSGAYDPIAPATGSLSASQSLWQLVFPHIGHGVLDYESCAEKVVGVFFAHPARRPSHSCLADLRPPAFHIRQIE